MEQIKRIYTYIKVFLHGCLNIHMLILKSFNWFCWLPIYILTKPSVSIQKAQNCSKCMKSSKDLAVFIQLVSSTKGVRMFSMKKQIWKPTWGKMKKGYNVQGKHLPWHTIIERILYLFIFSVTDPEYFYP